MRDDDDGLIPSRSIRRPLRRFVWLVVAALVLEAAIVVGIAHYRDQQIRQLACGLVRHAPAGRDPLVDELRAGYDCPPYTPWPSTPAGRPAPSPTSTTAAAPGPSSTTRRPRPRPVTRATPPPRTTATRPPSRPSSTTRPTPPAPSPTSPGLPPVLCRLLPSCPLPTS